MQQCLEHYQPSERLLIFGNRLWIMGFQDDSSMPIMDQGQRPRGDEDGSISYEFIALAALFDGYLEFGKRSLTVDLNYHLKTMFTYLAGLDQERKLHKLPGGKALLDALASDEITRDMIHDVLACYFMFLRDQALDHARGPMIAVKHVIFIYPSYLLENEQEDDFEKFRNFHSDLIRGVWDMEELAIHFVSEGRAAALYVCEPTIEDQNAYKHSGLWGQFRELHQRNEPLSHAVLDNAAALWYVCSNKQYEYEQGINTEVFQNVQVQTIYFDEDGDVLCSQSEFGPGSSVGKTVTRTQGTGTRAGELHIPIREAARASGSEGSQAAGPDEAIHIA
ncbi:hypothetical protein CHU98_g285 [Xylaria longipes]|nr:hypothetical protein CHU98_g285 [Xylaria longipes]